MRKLAFVLILLLGVITLLLGSTVGCGSPPSQTESPGPVLKEPSKMVLEITDLQGEGWTLTESVPVPEHGAEYAWQVGFERSTPPSSSADKERVSNKVATYYEVQKARQVFAAIKPKDVAPGAPQIGDEAFWESQSVGGGKSLVFRKSNVIVWLWLSFDDAIEPYARTIEQRIE